VLAAKPRRHVFRLGRLDEDPSTIVERDRVTLSSRVAAGTRRPVERFGADEFSESLS
jgi:hypothetical protein